MKKRLVVSFLLFFWSGLGAADDPFAFFQPSVVITPAERQSIDRGKALVRVLPGRDKEVAIFAAVALDATGKDLVAGVRRIADLKRSPYVLALRRFSDPPALHDLDQLFLDDADLESIQRCRPGSCEVKLGATEMERLKRAPAGPANKPALQELFRRLILERVQAYLARGHEGIPNYEAGEEAVNLRAGFSEIVRGSPFLRERLPEFAGYLENYPKAKIPEVESFLYWSKEKLGKKPVISVTHVSIAQSDGRSGLPEALIAGKQVFATHYLNASLNLTAIVASPASSRKYLVVLNRSQVDLLGGYFTWIKRALIERRLKDETQKIVLGLRQRLEKR